MATHHASSGEMIDVRPVKGGLKTMLSKALFKTERLEVSRTVLLAGEEIPTHQLAGEMTIQCLEGSIELTAAGATRLMRPGDLICLAGGETHAIKSLQDSSLLVTMVLHTATSFDASPHDPALG